MSARPGLEACACLLQPAFQSEHAQRGLPASPKNTLTQAMRKCFKSVRLGRRCSVLKHRKGMLSRQWSLGRRGMSTAVDVTSFHSQRSTHVEGAFRCSTFGRQALDVAVIPALSDNYTYIARDAHTKEVFLIDPPDASLAQSALKQLEHAGGWDLDAAKMNILVTHHHHDHTGGVAELQRSIGARVICGTAAADAGRIPGKGHVTLSDGQTNADCGVLSPFTVFDTPGHTRDHVCFHFEAAGALFSGDTLFALGCGRLFEGSPQQMYASLTRLASLPPRTLVFCGHEYTESNASFSLHVDPANKSLQQRVSAVKQRRQQQLPTIPSTIAQELATNPFLRADILQGSLPSATSPVEAFAQLRALKDSF